MKKTFRAVAALVLALVCLLTAIPVGAVTVNATFTVDGTTYKTLSSDSGSVQLPAAPASTSGVFVGWLTTDANGEKALYPAGATVALSGDVSFEAVMISYTACEGASVRLVEDDVALRFTSKIAQSDYAALTSYVGQENIAFGTYIIAEDYLYKTYFVFTLEALANAGCNKYLDIPARGWYEKDTNFYYVAGSVAHIRDENYSRSYAGIGYMKVTYADGTVGTVYSDFHYADNARNIYNVVLSAYEDRSANHLYVIPAGTHGSEFVTHSPYTLTQLNAMKTYLDSVAAVQIMIVNSYYQYSSLSRTYYQSPWRVSYTGDEYERYTVTVTAPAGSSISDVKALYFGGSRFALENNSKVTTSESAIVIQHSSYTDPY